MTKVRDNLNEAMLTSDASATLARGARGSWMVSVAGLAIAFVTTMLLTRTLGERQYGALMYAAAWAEVLGMLAPLGADKLIIRELARFRAQHDWSQARGIMRWTMRCTFAGTAVAIAIALLFGWIMRDQLDAALFPVFWFTAALIPARAFLQVKHGELIGASRPVAALAATSVNFPLVWLILTGAVLWVAGANFSTTHAAFAALGGLLIATWIARWQLHATIDRDALCNAQPQAHSQQWFREALPMMFIIALALINLRMDVIMLGAMRPAEEPGIYWLAAQLAFLIRLAIVAVNPALAPLAASRDGAALQSAARAASRLAFVPALVCAIGLVIAGRWVLGLFAPAFVAGYPTMMILVASLLIVTAMGPVETVLMMKGGQGAAARAAASAAAINIVLNALFIPQWGMVGAAIATAISTIAWGLAMTLAVRRRLGFGMSIISRDIVDHPEERPCP